MSKLNTEDYARATFALEYGREKGWKAPYTDEQIAEALSYVAEVKDTFREVESLNAVMSEILEIHPDANELERRIEYRMAAKNYAVRPWDDPGLLGLMWEGGKKTKSAKEQHRAKWRKRVAALDGREGLGVSKAKIDDSVWARKIIDGLSLHVAQFITTYHRVAEFKQGKPLDDFISYFQDFKLVERPEVGFQLVLWKAGEHPYDTNSNGDVVVDISRLESDLNRLKLSRQKIR